MASLQQKLEKKLQNRLQERVQKEQLWSLYLVRCRDNSLYCGITVDVLRRFSEHCAGGRKGARCLRGKQPLTMVFQQVVGSHSRALKLEYRLKQQSKSAKERLVAGSVTLDELLVEGD